MGDPLLRPVQPAGPLPVEEVLPELVAALGDQGRAVLVAPAGAGKTTRVPLALLDQPWASEKGILVLEPRRLAARAAASHMAWLLHEDLGGTIGLRARLGTQVSSRTRIEVVTEGVFTRLVIDDPELTGVAAVIFDEFHERSLDADLGLALALDVRGALRPDLRLLVMSATLEAGRVARLLDNAPVIVSTGRMFPVATRYLGRDPSRRIEEDVAQAIARATRSDAGSVLAFLPGAAEIQRCETLLRSMIEGTIQVLPLHGGLDPAAQDRAIAPASGGERKVVLATSIAETSLTIEGVRIVVDSGLARRPRYEPAVGFTRLETVRVSKAAAEQRRGRAGRTAPGICLRLWDEPQTASLEENARPEILATDLSGFLLDLAAWGVSDPGALPFLDPPPAAAMAEARKTLEELEALDHAGRITPSGRALQRLPLPVRLGRMLLAGAQHGQQGSAAQIALLITERGLGGNSVDLRDRLDTLRRDRSSRGEQARKLAQRWSRLAADIAEGTGLRESSTEPAWSPGHLIAIAYPERVAQNRGDARFQLANGRGVRLDPASPLASEAFLAVAEVAGAAASGRVLLAAPLTLAEIEQLFRAQIGSRTEYRFDPETARVRARETRALRSLTLSQRQLAVAPGPDVAEALVAGLTTVGLGRLPWTPDLKQWRDRAQFVRSALGDPWPDLSDPVLLANAGDWLAPALDRVTGLDDLDEDAFRRALRSLMPQHLHRQLEDLAPARLAVPNGRTVAIDYADPDNPKLSARLQDLIGLSTHPKVVGGRVALLVELLSPASRPIQVTRDLPGFWKGSYAEVRAAMRGRYPKHAWPDEPWRLPPPKKE